VTNESLEPLALGPDVVQMLLPHRRPFLMVDSVEAFGVGPRPALRAARCISANEPVFEGHFPGLSLWPGVYTIEGLGQTCNILVVLLVIRDGLRAAGHDPAIAGRALIEVERSCRLQPHDTTLTEPFLSALRSRRSLWNIGMSAAVNVKLQRPVFAGQRLTYEVERTHVLEGLARFDVSATVDGQVVASGTMTGAVEVMAPMGKGEA
jgi:3-hydroxyacyl-[acyl-carrier-protein] dehydratase